MSHSKSTAVTYLRVSGKGQVRGDGFPRQRAACAAYAKRHGVELVGEYLDEGVSGTRELADRPGLADLVARLRSNGVRLVLVENASRLARDLMVQEVILSELRKLGVTVIAADAGTDLTVSDDDPTRKLIRQVLGAVAEFEKAMVVAKLRAARLRIRRYRPVRGPPAVRCDAGRARRARDDQAAASEATRRGAQELGEDRRRAQRARRTDAQRWGLGGLGSSAYPAPATCAARRCGVGE